MELGASKNKNLLGEDRSEATPTLSYGTGGASHFRVDITKYAASRLSQSAKRLTTRSSDFQARDKSLFEHLLLLRIRSFLGPKLKLSDKSETNVSKARPFTSITTSHTLLKERTFFLERLQHSLG
jgi:hypothetical protein